MTTSYAALGDSFAAGVGAGDEILGFWRTSEGYPVHVARTLGLELTYEACLGSTVADVERDQLGALGGDTAYVSITVGGNDIGFVPILIACAEPAWMSDSAEALAAGERAIGEMLPGRLAVVYAKVAGLAPAARVVVTDYPRLFHGVDCNLVTFFSDEEMARLNAAADALAAVIRAAATAAGFDWAPVLTDFVGHAVCDEPEWLNGVAWPIQGSFHPNALGHRGYGRRVAQAFSPGRPDALEPDAAQGRDRAEPRIVQGRARRGSAPAFHLPNLLSARSLDGARRHGLDPAEIAALAARTGLTGSAAPPAGGLPAVEAGSVAAFGAPDGDALARLHELDELVRARR